MEQISMDYELIGQVVVFFMLTLPVLLGFVFGLEWVVGLFTRIPNQVASLDTPRWEGGFDGEAELRRRYGMPPSPKH